MPSRTPQPTNDTLCRFNGRIFSAFAVQNNVYCFPIDSSEQERLEDFDELLHELCGQRSFIAPFNPQANGNGNGNDSDSLPTVLDCGFGGGAWIERLLEEYDGALDIFGIDLCLNQGGSNSDSDGELEPGSGDVDAVQEYSKKRWNLNAPFREDRSDTRLRPETFDLINSRLLSGGIKAERWTSYVKDLRQLLKPGGWLQMVEIYPHLQSRRGLLRDDSYLNTWWQWYSRTMEAMGHNVRIGRNLRRLLQSERFVQITERIVDLPVGSWDEGRAVLGRTALANVEHMLISHSLWPMLRVGRMSEDAYRTLVQGARAELRDSSLQLYFKLYIVFGRRRPS